MGTDIIDDIRFVQFITHNNCKLIDNNILNPNIAVGQRNIKTSISMYTKSLTYIQYISGN